jgi:branched-chain amino acid transport system permease protein
MTRSLTSRAAVGLFLLAIAVVPLIGNSYQTRLAALALVYGIGAIGLNLLVGYGGMISFGHAAFFGIGAYTVAILGLSGLTSTVVTLPCAMAAGVIGALLIGALSLRMTGAYFIMITLAFAQMLFYGSVAITKFGGDEGITTPRGDLLGFDLHNGTTFFYLVFTITLATLYLSRRIVASRFGRVLRAINDNERRAVSVGYNTYAYKLIAFAIAGGMAGLGGALMANLNEYAAPSLFHWILSGEFLVMVILGGLGTLIGPLLGAILFVLLQTILSAYTTYWMLILGPIMLLIVMFSSGGVVLLLKRAGEGSRV